MSEAERERIAAILRRCLGRRPEILEAYLFGSVATGGEAAHSDIDVAIYVDPDCLPESSFDYVSSITTDLLAALGRNSVDLIVLNRASPLLYHRVLRDGIRVLTHDLAETTTREGQALSRYCDLVPHLRKVDALHAARIRSGNFGR